MTIQEYYMAVGKAHAEDANVVAGLERAIDAIGEEYLVDQIDIEALNEFIEEHMEDYQKSLRKYGEEDSLQNRRDFIAYNMCWTIEIKFTYDYLD
jgi:hypothetical protein